MISIIRRNTEEIDELIELTAARKKLNTVIVEKDLWVCYLLDYLFNRCKYKEYFEFKGGTSLSKAYGLIERFSEDVDIVLKADILGANLSSIIELDSRNQKNKLSTELNKRALQFYKDKLKPLLEKDLYEETNKVFEIRIDESDMAIYLKYPSSQSNEYIRNEIKLEIGPLAAWTPFESRSIKSFIAEVYPDLFEVPEFNVMVTKPIRTFWEKAVILHQEANRVDGKVPRRYSRHYYDIYKMYDSDVKMEALNSLDLLDEVREFTETFYNRGWAKFDEAKPGTFKLVPNEVSMPALQSDYENMKIMIYGEMPDFNDILKTMKQLEDEINQGEQ